MSLQDKRPVDRLFSSPTSRRRLLQLGSAGCLGIGLNSSLTVEGTAVAADSNSKAATAKSVIYIFLSGGMTQLDTFDLKPEAPVGIRGEFQPIATRVPGLEICEHLPKLAERSHLWSLVRTMSHPSNGHTAGHAFMLAGRSHLPPGFNGGRPTRFDWPSISAMAGAATQRRSLLPATAVLPDKLIHWSGRTIPGQFGGQMGSRRDPWFIEASPYRLGAHGPNGAFPEYDFIRSFEAPTDSEVEFKVPKISLHDGIDRKRWNKRLCLLDAVEQRFSSADHTEYQLQRERAVGLLADSQLQSALDVTQSKPELQDRYGRNSFGWSLLMARRLVEMGVNFVQVHLGNNETWDLHGGMYPLLKDCLLPPTDRALSALLDDLEESGMLDDTLIVMAGEMGRTPKISTLTGTYKLPGRDHWGAVQSVLFAGGGVQGGRVIGATDKQGGDPISDRQTPENMAATMYHALGIPHAATWLDEIGRPNRIYHGEPIYALL